MQVYIATPAMVGGQVEDNLNALHCHPSNSWLSQVSLNEFHHPIGQVSLDVLQPAAGKIVHDTHLRPTFQQRVAEMGADERSSASDKDTTILPIHNNHLLSDIR
jgi:hypothetical protein